MNVLKKPFPARFILLFFAFLLNFTVQAQNISLRVEKATVREVMEKIQNEYGYSFTIHTNSGDINKVISMSVKDADINQALEEIFKNSSLTYSINGKIISVNDRTKSSADKTDDVTVSGTVVDMDGIPLTGASVMIKGTKTGTVTDLDGKFTLGGGI